MTSNALFGGLSSGPMISELRLEDIRPDPQQPRKTFGDGALRELADSIEQHGLLQPIVVRKDPEHAGKYLITAGERRFRAVRLLKQKAIQAIVRNEDNAAVVAIVENLQRVDLSPIEEAEAIARLIDEQGLNQVQAGKLVGKNRLTINQLLKINELPTDIRAAAVETDVSKSILVELAQLQNTDLQQRLWRRAKDGNLTVAEIRRARKAEEVMPPSSETKAEDEGGVRRLTPLTKNVEQVGKAIEKLRSVDLTDEDRAELLRLAGTLDEIAKGEAEKVIEA